MKPNLFIVGAPKCGTTAWFNYLRTHPDIYFPKGKEPSFFALDLPRIRVVKSLSAYKLLFAGSGRAKISGDASTIYLYSTSAAKEIHKYNPKSKILIFLRDQEYFLPSLHHQYVYTFDEPIGDFSTAWRLSGERSLKLLPKDTSDPAALDYAARGRFYEQVKRYIDTFPAEQIRVFRFAEWTEDPRRTYVEILDFLGLEDDGRKEFPIVNEAKSHKYRWIGRLLFDPPKLVKKAISPVKKITGLNPWRFGRPVAKLLAAPGYRTSVASDIRDEIKSYYEENNRLLDEELAKLRAAQLPAHQPSSSG